jgi:hypothetical protein
MGIDAIAHCYAGSWYCCRQNNGRLSEAKLEDAKPSSHPTTRQEIEDTSLSAKLSAYRRESGNRLPAFAKAYDELVQRLHVLDQGQVGPKLGEPCRIFACRTTTGI